MRFGSHLLDARYPGLRCAASTVPPGDVLDYETERATGLSVVAIGGDKLSRGLTL